MSAVFIYHICKRRDWEAARKAGRYEPPEGPETEAAQRFIHFSTAAQVAESAAEHWAGQDDLVLLAADPGRLGKALHWEPSRSGALFPHLYGPLPLAAVVAVHDLPLGKAGRHVIPPLD